MSTPTETLAERYARLQDEHYHLRRIHRDQRTPADRTAMANLAEQLAAILATPPAGYTLPAAAQRLIDHATGHGWQALVQWYPAPGGDETAEPFVQVCVGRYLTATEQAAEDHRGPRWQYLLTWHSRGCPPGRLRRFGQGLAETPTHPATHDAPSLTAITNVITAHPGSDT